MKRRIDRTKHYFLLITGCIAMAGCLSGGGSSESPSPDPNPGPGPGTTNRPPSISGSPAPSIVVGQDYLFTPTASDPDNDTLTFAIQNQPAWTSFDNATGTLSGTAAQGTEGTYANIEISVSDGSVSTAMQQFSIEVMQAAQGSTTLTWTAPTENTDGSSLTNLAAYKIYYGTSPGSYPNEIRIDNPGMTTYVIENLAPDTYYFVATAINSNEVESSFSGMATATVN